MIDLTYMQLRIELCSKLFKLSVHFSTELLALLQLNVNRKGVHRKQTDGVPDNIQRGRSKLKRGGAS